jgi:dTDP-L-rhamnose 4-epimerase
MPRLLVTGGAGFIGSHIVDSALEQGWTVRVVDSFRPDVHAPDMIESLTHRDDIELYGYDLTDRGAAADILVDVDVVCHQAAKVGLGVDFDDAPDYVASNVAATANLLTAMTHRGLDRLVLASSMVVYGEGLYRDGGRSLQPPARHVQDLEVGLFDPRSDDGTALEPTLIDENDRLDPRNVYAASKLAQEHLAASWARSTGGRVAALRYHNVFGPRMPVGTPYAGVAALFRTMLARGEAPRVFEDGLQRRDFIDVRDVAGANVAAIHWTDMAPHCAFRAFNIGSGTVHTVADFASALTDSLDGPRPVITGQYRLGDVRHITASSARARQELGWTPRYEFLESVRDFATAPLRAPATTHETEN